MPLPLLDLHMTRRIFNVLYCLFSMALCGVLCRNPSILDLIFVLGGYKVKCHKDGNRIDPTQTVLLE